jgi:FkbM family methyltransferase
MNYSDLYYKIIHPYWRFIRVKILSRKQLVHKLKTSFSIGCGKPAVEFFSQNKDRVKKIANLLSDDESKKTYLKIIKYRQTLNFLDYPKYNRNGYFFNSFFAYSNNEVLIDCGAFTGDTIQEFLAMEIQYQKIIAFEPGFENFQILKNNYGENPKIMLVNAGTYSKNSTLYFSGTGDFGIISETSKKVDGEISVNVRSIDSLHLQEKVTFIKMDIEGSELNALVGAKETILRDKPKLAISIYHSNEDMVSIAEYIYKIAPEYKFYVRHNQTFPHAADTVLYAT